MLSMLTRDFFRMSHVDSITFADLLPDGERRVEGRHGFLKDHRNFSSADFFHFTVCFSEQVFTLKKYLASDNLAGRRRDEAQNRKGSHGFAAARLSHNP